jgi:uncharacterized membrane protein
MLFILPVLIVPFFAIPFQKLFYRHSRSVIAKMDTSQTSSEYSRFLVYSRLFYCLHFLGHRIVIQQLGCEGKIRGGYIITAKCFCCLFRVSYLMAQETVG